MKILVVSDFHADMYKQYAKPVEGKPWNSRFQNQLDTLNKVFGIAEKENAVVVFNGDLYNQRKQIDQVVFNEITKAIATGSRLLKQPIYVLVGNHDQYDNSPKPASSVEYLETVNPNIHVINSVESVSINSKDNTDLIFMPYSEDTDMILKGLDDVVASLPDKDNAYLFAHIGVSGSKQGRWNHKLGGAFNLDELHPKRFSQIVLGHYHLRQELTDNVYYVGNTVPLNHNDDSQSKGVVLIDTEDNSHKFIEMDNPKFYTVDLAVDKMTPEELQELSAKNFVKVIAHSKDELEQLSEDKEDSMTLAYVAETTDESRLGVSAEASEKEIVAAYTDKYHPNVKNLALEELNKVGEA
ncbi:hypothetical protein GPK34_00640 [Secundilactobacillus kimchicus]|uniref:metallophosphoesterase family protein n=1 Tax=Secundilactobacillus kimchicus TaxID=528209 RepID=UPI001C037ADF|nr:hypothetical protein [Secundilactobacillus kimchicus]